MVGADDARLTPRLKMLTEELVTLIESKMFNDTVLHCADGMVSFPRAMVALAYPSLYSVLRRREEDMVTLIMPQFRQTEVEHRVHSFLTHSLDKGSGSQSQDHLQPTGERRINN